jgi:7-cyano-7-deazaguanine reductase
MARSSGRTRAPRERAMPATHPSAPSKDLQVFANPAPERDYVIRFDVPEFTCLCPLTGQPDFAHFTIEIVPDKLCVELKSLKMYFWSFRDEGAFHEKVTNTIVDDLVRDQAALRSAERRLVRARRHSHLRDRRAPQEGGRRPHRLSCRLHHHPNEPMPHAERAKRVSSGRCFRPKPVRVAWARVCAIDIEPTTAEHTCTQPCPCWSRATSLHCGVAPRYAAGQRQLPLQPELPALPRECRTHREEMSGDTVDLVLEVLRARQCKRSTSPGCARAEPALPPTGQAPRTGRAGDRPLQPDDPLRAGSGRPCRVLAGERIEIVASLPCYSLERVDRQRGTGVFDKSIAALQKLNALGYGQPDSG